MTRTGFEGSPEVGGKDKDRRREVQGPEREERSSVGGGRNGGGSGGDPTAQEKGLVESITETLDEWSNDIQDAFSGTPGDDRITSPQERTGVRPPNDERPPRPAVKPPEEEELIVPGDPDDLGARGRRRSARDIVNASPVLRRGLLGV